MPLVLQTLVFLCPLLPVPFPDLVLNPNKSVMKYFCLLLSNPSFLKQVVLRFDTPCVSHA